MAADCKSAIPGSNPGSASPTRLSVISMSGAPLIANLFSVVKLTTRPFGALHFGALFALFLRECSKFSKGR
jgi:hypothetical protein